MKTRGEIRCYERVSIYCFACGIRYDVPYVVSRKVPFFTITLHTNKKFQQLCFFTELLCIVILFII